MGGLVLLLDGGGNMGVVLLDMRLKATRAIKSPGNSLLPAGVADMVLLVVPDLLDALVDTPLVPLEMLGMGEADETDVALVKLLSEMDCGLVPGQTVSLAETQAAGGTLNNISIITRFTPN